MWGQSVPVSIDIPHFLPFVAAAARSESGGSAALGRRPELTGKCVIRVNPPYG